MLVFFIFLQFLALTFIFYIFIAALIGAPFLPSGKNAVKQMVNMADIKKGDICTDLGSGDGRIVMEMAKKGARVYGLEVNPFLVLWSRFRIKKAHLENNAMIVWKSFWKEDFYKYDVITVYGIPNIMPRLEKKLLKETNSDVRIISYLFRFPNLKIQKNNNGVFLYRLKKYSQSESN